MFRHMIWIFDFRLVSLSKNYVVISRYISYISLSLNNELISLKNHHKQLNAESYHFEFCRAATLLLCFKLTNDISSRNYFSKCCIFILSMLFCGLHKHGQIFVLRLSRLKTMVDLIRGLICFIIPSKT